MTISIYSGGIKTFPCLAVDSAGGIGVGNVGTTTIVVARRLDSSLDDQIANGGEWIEERPSPFDILE